jgi:iron complex transport system substrate-binding protein
MSQKERVLSCIGEGRGVTGAAAAVCLLLVLLAAGCMGAPAAASPAPAGQAPSPRIVCLSSDAAELLVIIGAGDHIVGVPETLIQRQPELLPFLPNIVSVGDATKPDNERILALKPDIVMFVSRWRPATADIWEVSGIRLMPVESHNAADLPLIARQFGQLTGHHQRAEEYAVFCEEITGLVSYRLDAADPARPRVYIESYTDFVPFGNVSAAESLIRTLHAGSISGQVFFNATRVSPEWVVNQDPDFIIKMVIPDDTKTLESEHARVLKREGVAGLTATRGGQVHVFNGNLLFSAQAPVGMVFMAKTLHPEQFADICPEEYLQEYADRFLPGVDQRQTMYPVPWHACQNRQGSDPS